MTSPDAHASNAVVFKTQIVSTHFLLLLLSVILCSPASPGGPAGRWEGPGQGKQPGSHPSLHGTGCLAHGERHTHSYASIISGTSLPSGICLTNVYFPFAKHQREIRSKPNYINITDIPIC